MSQQADRVVIDRVTLNRMSQAYGVGGRPPTAAESKLDKDWYQHVPEHSEDRPVGFPLVDYQNHTFEQFQQAERERLQEALGDVEATTGIGPWILEDQNGGGCGPIDPNSRTGMDIASFANFAFVASIEATPEQFAEVVSVLNGHYPGIAERSNQYRQHDEPEHMAWHMASDRDDNIMVTYRTGRNRLAIDFHTGCFITADDLSIARRNAEAQ